MVLANLVKVIPGGIDTFKTRVTELLDIERPIIQGGMRYVACAELAAAVRCIFGVPSHSLKGD